MARDDIPEFISARDLAKRLGIKTNTLKAWRASGRRGPRGWVRFSGTHISYPLALVQLWLEETRRGEPRSMDEGKSDRKTVGKRRPRGHERRMEPSQRKEVLRLRMTKLRHR